MDDFKKIRIGLKLDAELNGRLSQDELKLLPHTQRKELRDSVAAYLDLIDTISHE